MKAEIGTPSGFSQAGSRPRQCAAAPGKPALGGPALTPERGPQLCPSQSLRCAGGCSVMPSHHTSPSVVVATFVNRQFFSSVAMALGLDCCDVPGATPKKPYSGLMAYRRPSAPGRIHAMSSPTVVTFQPLNAGGGTSIARLVLPHARGNPAPPYRFSPLGACTPRISRCSASQPCARPMLEAMRSARHFLPSSAFPPYPLPKDQMAFSSVNWTMYLCCWLHGQGTSLTPGARGMRTEGSTGAISPLLA